MQKIDAGGSLPRAKNNKHGYRFAKYILIYYIYIHK